MVKNSHHIKHHRKVFVSNSIVVRQNVHFLLEIPAVAVSGASEEAESAAEGSSGACMGPPSTAATQPSEQSEDMLEGEDGVSIFDEKFKILKKRFFVAFKV